MLRIAEDRGRPRGVRERVPAGVVGEVAHAGFDSVEHGAGAVVLLEDGPVRRKGGDGDPRPILGQRILRPGERGGGDGRVRAPDDGHERGQEQRAENAAYRTERARTVWHSRFHDAASTIRASSGRTRVLCSYRLL